MKVFLNPRSKTPLLFQALKFRKKLNRDSIIIVLGEKRTGKSYGAIKIAESIQSGFDAGKQVFFAPKDFVKFMRNNRDSVAVLDEASMYMSNRDWYDVSNKIMNGIFTTQGYRRNTVILTLPHLNHLDKRQIQLAHYLLVTYGYDAGRMKCYRIKNSQFGKGDFYPVAFEFLKFGLPNKKNLEVYEKMKDVYNKKLLEKNDEFFKALEEQKPQVKSFPAKFYINAYKKGKLDRNNAMESLKNIGYHETDINIMLETAKTEQKPQNQM